MAADRSIAIGAFPFFVLRFKEFSNACLFYPLKVFNKARPKERPILFV